MTVTSPAVAEVIDAWYDDITNEVNDLRTTRAGSWTLLTLLNSWTNRSGFVVVRARIIGGHSVQLAGNLVPGTTTGGTHVFQLPAGMRPTSTIPLPCTDGGGNCHLEINSSGYADVWGWSAGYMGFSGMIPLGV